MALLLAGTAGAGDDDAAGSGTAAIYRRLRAIDERMQHEADHPASIDEADEAGGRPHGGAATDAGDLGSDDEDGDSGALTPPAPPHPAAPGIGGGRWNSAGITGSALACAACCGVIARSSASRSTT